MLKSVKGEDDVQNTDVEDDRVIADKMKEHLEKWDYEVACVQDSNAYRRSIQRLIRSL